MVLGTLVEFFGTGFFAGSGIIGSEIFPTRVRARALGFTYNGARALSCIAPYTIGYVADKLGPAKGMGWAFLICAVAFLLAMIMASQLPETKGKQLEQFFSCPERQGELRKHGGINRKRPFLRTPVGLHEFH